MDRQKVARTFGRTFEEIGFACIVGHGIPEEIVLRTYDAARRFFDLPEQEKLVSTIADRVKDRGYVPMGVESVAITRNKVQPPDLCEALVFNAIDKEAGVPQPGAISTVTGNLYPRAPEDLAAAFHDYFHQIDKFAGRLMQIAALALDLPEDFFAPYTDRRRGRLRVINYPDQGKDPLPGQLRYGAHSDYGSFTILRQDAAPGGTPGADAKRLVGRRAPNAGSIRDQYRRPHGALDERSLEIDLTSRRQSPAQRGRHDTPDFDGLLRGRQCRCND